MDFKKLHVPLAMVLVRKQSNTGEIENGKKQEKFIFRRTL
jgi:hypothetical protein